MLIGPAKTKSGLKDNKGGKIMYRTEQEQFWSGEFGDEYIERNNNEICIASNIKLFAKILSRIGGGYFKCN